MTAIPTNTASPKPDPVNASPAGAPVVACQALSKHFKDFWLRDRARAVDNLSLRIDNGEIFGLLGPNGSGKSTTIKMILGLLKPTRGRVLVFGKPPTDVATKKRIGYLPEESYLYGFLNARETLDYYGKLFGLDASTRSKRIDELLEMVGLDAAQHRPVREYSKGMQRRIGLAQALINDPDLLILDEPTTGLDPIGTRQVKDLIIELGRRGKTIILSSHLLADVEDVVSRMVILYGGKIRDEGTCDELLTKGGTTTIEADELDDATLAEIDRVIRERSGGHQSIQRVTKPRQKLEELFVGIVERARTEQLSTSGASAGGATAAFLQSDGASSDAGDGPSGDDLISSLVSTTPHTEATEPGATGQPAAPVQDVAAATNANPPEPEAPGIDRAALEALSNAGSMDAGLMDDGSAGIGAERPSTRASGASSDATRRGDQQRDTTTSDSERSKSDGPKVDLGVIGSLLDASPGDADDDSKPTTDASSSVDDDTPETTR